jgi:hypothetical protein
MNLRDRIPRLEIHIRDMSTGWEICTAWKVPPSACVQARLRKHEVNSMTVDTKPRNNAAYTKSTFPDWLQHHSKNCTLLRESKFSADVKSDSLGYNVSGAVQKLGLSDDPRDVREVNAPPLPASAPQFRHISHIRSNQDIVLRGLYFNICQDERYPDKPLSEPLMRAMRGNALTFMYCCVSSAISCCPGAVRMVDQEDDFKRLMRYYYHRAMWYTQVGGILMQGASALHYQINLRSMLSNDIKTIEDESYVSHLQDLMSLRERHDLDYVHKAGIV